MVSICNLLQRLDLVTGAGILWRTGNQEEQRQHAGAEDGEVLDNVEIRKHGSLSVKLIVDVGLC